MPIEAEVLAKALAGLKELDSSASPVEVALGRIVDAAQSVFGVTGTGLLLLDENQVLRYVASSDETGRVLEVAQEQAGIGPCIDAVLLDSVVRVRDVATDPRYGAIAPTVVPHGVRAVLGVPVRVGGSSIGSINAYSDAPRDWDETEVEALQAFDALIEIVVATALLSEQRAAVIDQLQHALDNRVTIERAVGIVMHREHLDAVGAFNRLRTESRATRRKVVDVAREVIAAVSPRVDTSR